MSTDTPIIDLPEPTTQKQKRARRMAQKAYGVDPDAAEPAGFHLDTSGPEAPKPAEMVTIKLLKNYRPFSDNVEIVGYWQDEIKRKDPIGREVVIQPNEFKPDERKPAAVAGTGYANKILAGTVIRLPKDEARRARTEGIGEVEID